MRKSIPLSNPVEIPKTPLPNEFLNLNVVCSANISISYLGCCGSSTEYFYEENAPGTAYDNLGFFVNEILISLAASGAGVLNLQEGQLIGIASGDPNYSQAITNLLNSKFDNSDIT